MLLGYLEMLLCGATLSAIVARKQWTDYWALGTWLAVRGISGAALTGIFFVAHLPSHPLSKQVIYGDLYFPVYWISFALESIIALIVVYNVFRLAMAPLKGLQTLGTLVFKWAAGISVAVALGSAFGPDTTSGAKYIAQAISQLQRTQGILTLCLLLFVCFAIRPMGLSYGSRIFGVSLGLGIMATNDFVQSAWLIFSPKMHTAYSLINGVVACTVLATWTAYFAIPEPRRRLIVLPTTSPFLRWNQISQALGDDPGFVAVGGIPPDLFAPAELEVMRRASLKMVPPPAPKQVNAAVPARITASTAV
ncbi:MAG: hypothetical protein ABR910_00285 [Acidobacteriaceae bacterium]|jgi:hypothetical protein